MAPVRGQELVPNATPAMSVHLCLVSKLQEEAEGRKMHVTTSTDRALIRDEAFSNPISTQPECRFEESFVVNEERGAIRARNW